MFTIVLIFSYLYTYILSYFGISMGAPSFGREIWERVYLMLQASVWEEIVTRVMFIGVPLAFIQYRRGKSKNLRYLLGRYGTDDRIVIYLILISSLIFATAHVGGWNWWKFPQTFFPAILFGYLFVKDGLHSAILIHFLWNFMGVTQLIIGHEIYNILFFMATVLWLCAGVYYLYVYSNELFYWLGSQFVGDIDG